LVERFVFGTPIRRQRFRPAASAPTAERFYRTIRAYCLLDTARQCLQGPTPDLSVIATRSGAYLVGTHLANQRNLRAISWPDSSKEGAHQVMGVDVITQDYDEPLAGAFLAFSNHWIDIWRPRPGQSLELFLAEICWRFNHRDQDTYKLLVRGLRGTSKSSIETITKGR
jgi:hypothetical protein